MQIGLRLLLAFTISVTPLISTIAVSEPCAVLEEEVEFNRHEVFESEFAFIFENSGMLKKASLQFVKIPVEFMIKQRCAGCDINQYRAKVAKYLNAPYLFSQYVLAVASAGGLLTTLFAEPAQGTIMATWWAKLVTSSMLLGVSAYTGSQLKAELSDSGRRQYYQNKTVLDLKKTFAGFGRAYAGELREANFSGIEQGMEFPLSRANSFVHGAAQAAYASVFNASASPRDPQRYFALGLLSVAAYHPEFLAAMKNGGRNPYDFKVDSKFDNVANLLFDSSVQSEFFRKLFYGGNLKVMQPYLNKPRPEAEVFEYDAGKFRKEVMLEIQKMMKKNNMPPLSEEANQLFEIFLARVLPHTKTAISSYQLEKPKDMTIENWRRFLEDQGFTVIENDPYVNDRTGTVTAYRETLEGANGEKLGDAAYWASRKKAANTPFVYYMRYAD